MTLYTKLGGKKIYLDECTRFIICVKNILSRDFCVHPISGLMILCTHEFSMGKKKSVSKSVGNCDRKKDYKVLVSVIIYGIHGDDDNDDLGHTN